MIESDHTSELQCIGKPERSDWIEAIIEELQDMIDRLRGGESPMDGIGARLIRLGRIILRGV